MMTTIYLVLRLKILIHFGSFYGRKRTFNAFSLPLYYNNIVCKLLMFFFKDMIITVVIIINKIYVVAILSLNIISHINKGVR